MSACHRVAKNVKILINSIQETAATKQCFGRFCSLHNFCHLQIYVHKLMMAGFFPEMHNKKNVLEENMISMEEIQLFVQNGSITALEMYFVLIYNLNFIETLEFDVDSDEEAI